MKMYSRWCISGYTRDSTGIQELYRLVLWVGSLVGFLIGQLVAWSVGFTAIWLDGQLVSMSVSMVGQLIGWSVS